MIPTLAQRTNAIAELKLLSIQAGELAELSGSGTAISGPSFVSMVYIGCPVTAGGTDPHPQ
ncbi:hypothetical protein ACFW1A_26565 [Kitasatospora sp. NPDC058965]|uniref:hypothetical protein n=1 Tax=Kitasatospora sp. NPDC058965 TaxID=3346682 RepID=UPI0036B82D5C